jgi:phosphopantothenoylcysteine synthetase/decarboxylase
MSHIAVVAASAGGVEELCTHLVEPLVTAGHSVSVTLTPTAAGWLDEVGETERLAEVTGYRVRSQARFPGETSPHPRADLIIAAPLTANTTAKLALGIADNQALTFLCESLTVVPTIIFPRINAAHARHPAWRNHAHRLRSVAEFIEGPDIWPLHEPRSATPRPLPWHVLVNRAQQILANL